MMMEMGRVEERERSGKRQQILSRIGLSAAQQMRQVIGTYI